MLFGLARYGAVPESATWAMMLLGMAGLGFVGAKRRQNAAAWLRTATDF
jgi:hypothetical protein